MRGRTLILIAFAAGLPAWLSLAQPGASAEQNRDDTASAPIYGEYEYVGGQQQLEQMNREIEQGVEALSVFIRGIAERRLREANRPTDRLTIVYANGEITVARYGRPDMTAPASGTFIDWKHPENGNELRVSHQVRDGALLQRIEGERGSSVNRFVLSEDGQRLSVKTQVRVDRLEEPIRFDLSYRRASN